MLGLKLMVIIIIWGFNCLIKNVGSLSSSSLCPSFAFEMYVPCKVVTIFHLKHFVAIRLVGHRLSISKMPSLMCGHS